MISKKCRTCGKVKKTTDFYSHRTTADKLRPDCKQCISDYTRKRYAENTEKVRAINKDWVTRNYAHFRSQQNEYKNKIRGKVVTAGK